MKRRPLIVLVDQNDHAREKIDQLLSNLDAEILAVNDPVTLLSLMAERDYRINLIVTDLTLKSPDSSVDVDIPQLIRSKSHRIPIMTFMRSGQRESSTKCLFLGTNEYHLLPIDDQFIRDHLLKYLNWDLLSDDSVLNFNIKDYLHTEIYKASKGKYPMTMMKISFHFDGEDGQVGIGNNFHPHSEEIYQSFKKMLWDGDTNLQYGFQCHLGFFPFCDKRHTTKLIQKLEQRFYEVRATRAGLQNYKMGCVFACYPNDGCSSEEILNALLARDRASLTL